MMGKVKIIHWIEKNKNSLDHFIRVIRSPFDEKTNAPDRSVRSVSQPSAANFAVTSGAGC